MLGLRKQGATLIAGRACGYKGLLSPVRAWFEARAVILRRAGTARAEALHNLAERTAVDDIQSLVTMLVQTDKFGTSVSQSLRVHSETVRTKRRQRAEEAAAKTGVKLVFPLVFCLFPAMYVVVLGPAVLRIIRVLGSLF